MDKFINFGGSHSPGSVFVDDTVYSCCLQGGLFLCGSSSLLWSNNNDLYSTVTNPEKRPLLTEN